ncbi:LuxR C-terminal-related transcriptional regulator [Methylophaga sp. OBS4]|uniref:LuxR C-terminal-related transcriptional regulator n=1 Tax=Methylophaga sp. OBS4 TaxID=2991935 RepID=UPI0022531487|nr:helix-turn-helix transcriptional regulator [Methylophaga sp. OBS4]MCX4187191.1 helix-turn-helix transcriptional regulator [Methylophaga sp. OBS4]
MEKKLRAIIIERGPLTRQEANTLRYLAEGYTRSEIASIKLFRSPSTINRHVESIALKLDAHCTAEIVSTAVALEMVRFEFRTKHHLASTLLLCLLMVNITAGHLDMRRGPRSPRPVRTVRVSSRLTRTQRQYP